jgi:enoyl-CoA hydratase/carnithine racemase
VSTETVTSECASGVLTIRLNRPEKLNAMNADLLNSITAHLTRAAADAEVKVVVLTGNGRAFCAGGDLTATLGERQDALHSTVSMSMRSVEVFSLMEWLPKPIVAMVNGDTYAGGLGFVLYSDLAIAADTAGFCTPMATRGLYEPYTATRLAARIGVERTKYMLFTAKKISAAQALDWGMISEVHPLSNLQDATHELASQLATYDPYSLREYKYTVRRTLPGFDLGTFLNEAVAPETTAVMERFAKEFPVASGRASDAR